VKAEVPPPARARLTALAARSRKTWLGTPEEKTMPAAIGYDAPWRVFVNVPRAELQGAAGMALRKSVTMDL
jgi:hypothetical protein